MAKTIYFKDWLIFNSDIVWILEETDKVTKMFIPFLFVSVILTEQKFLFHQCQYTQFMYRRESCFQGAPTSH
jgi:hypothetical protein